MVNDVQIFIKSLYQILIQWRHCYVTIVQFPVFHTMAFANETQPPLAAESTLVQNDLTIKTPTKIAVLSK